MRDVLKMIVYPIAQILYDKKAMNILALDVQGISTMTDYMIIAEGNVNKHVSAMAKTIIEEMAEKGVSPSRIEGVTEGDWAVLDFNEVVVHLFQPGYREKYMLERLFPDSKLIDLPLEIGDSAMNG